MEQILKAWNAKRRALVLKGLKLNLCILLIFHDLSIGSSSTASTQLTQPNATRSRDHPPSSLASTSELSWNPPPQRVVSWTNGFGCLLTNGFARISCRRKTSVWPPPRAGDSIVAPYDFLDACLRWAARPWKPLRFEASHAPATGPRRIERSTGSYNGYAGRHPMQAAKIPLLLKSQIACCTRTRLRV